MAIERKPDCEGAYWTSGQACLVSARWEEAAAVAEQVIKASGDDYNVYVPFSQILQRLGETEATRNLQQRQIEVMERHLEWVPEDVRARILPSSIYASFGREKEAMRELLRAQTLRPDDPNILYNAACTYGIMQKKAEALALLRKAKEAGFITMEWAARDPDLACLHSDAEFHKLVSAAEKGS